MGLSGCLDGGLFVYIFVVLTLWWKDGLYKHGGRPALNLVIVLDISGSMGDRFNSTEESSKLDVAKNSILTLLTKLNERDRFGLILFDTVIFILSFFFSYLFN